MKRLLLIAFLVVLMLTGVTFTAEAWSARAPYQGSSPSALAAWIANVQMNGLPLPEPASIILSSLVLLGGATAWRRRRTNRRA